MDYREVCDFFGGSIFHEDFRCDLRFSEFTRKVDTFSSSRAGSEYDHALTQDLLRAVFATLRGQTADALAILLRSHGRAEDVSNSRWVLRFKAYIFYTLTVHFYPPLLRCRPLQPGPTSSLDGIEIADWCKPLPWTDAVSYLKALSADEPSIDLDLLEMISLFAYWWVNHHAISTAQSVSNEDVDQHADDSLSNPTFLLSSTVLLLRHLHNHLRSAGLPKVSSFMQRLLCETLAALPNGYASQALEALLSTYQVAGDETGVVIVRLMQGDFLVCGSQASPITLNLPLVESWTPGPSPIPEGGLSDAFSVDTLHVRTFTDGDVNGATKLYKQKQKMSAHIELEIAAAELWPSANICYSDVKPSLKSTASTSKLTQPASVHTSVNELDHQTTMTTITDKRPRLRRCQSLPAFHEAHHEVRQQPDLGQFVSSERLHTAKRLYQAAEESASRLGCIRLLATCRLRVLCLRILHHLHATSLAPVLDYAACLTEYDEAFDEVVSLFKASQDSMSHKLVLVLRFLWSTPSHTSWNDTARLGVLEGDSPVFISLLALLALRHGTFHQWRTSQTSAAHTGYLASHTIMHSLHESWNSPDNAVLEHIYGQPSTSMMRLATSLSDLCHRMQLGWDNIPTSLLVETKDCLCKSFVVLLDTVKLPLRVQDAIASTLLESSRVYIDCLEGIGAHTMRFYELLEELARELVLSIHRLRLVDHPDDRVTSIVKRALAMADMFKLRSSYLKEARTGDVDAQVAARHKTSTFGAKLVKTPSLWPWALTFVGRTMETIGFPEARDLCASLLDACGDVEASQMAQDWTNPSVRWSYAFRLEQQLESAVSIRAWPRADDILMSLAKLIPGYLTHFACASKMANWRRALLIAQIRYGTGQRMQALRYALAAKGQLEINTAILSSPDSQIRFQSHPDMSAIPTLCARILIEAHSTGRLLDRVGGCVLGGKDAWGVFGFLQGPIPLLDELSYANLVIYFLEEEKAVGLRTILKLSKDQDLTSQPVLQQWHSRRRTENLYYALKTASRPLSHAEEAELHSLEDDPSFLWKGIIGADLGLGETFPSVVDFSYIPGNAVVIYTGLSIHGLAVIAITSAGIQGMHYAPDMDERQLGNLVNLYQSALRESQSGVNVEYLHLLAWELASHLLEPFQGCVAAAEHVIFIPSGKLVKFPLGALPFEGQYLLSRKAVSQCPSLSYLHSMTNKTVSADHQIRSSVVVRPGSFREEMLGGEAALPLAALEAMWASFGHVQNVRQADDIATSDIGSVFDADIVHIATHGYEDLDAALLSRLSLGQKSVRVVDLLGVTSRAEVVVLSACSTALGTETVGSDFYGFSHAILAAGASLCIGALWPTDDLVTLIHMSLFYQQWLSASETTLAWHEATCRLASMTAESAEAFLQELIELWDGLESEDKNPDSLVKGGKLHLQRAIKGLRDSDGESRIQFSHPYYWAPFSLCGYSRIVVRMRRAEDEPVH